MELNDRQFKILLGTLLGDAYLQPTGKTGARLRLEHSFKQKEYLCWKYAELEHIFPSEPLRMQRLHPGSQRTYDYVRVQSYASQLLGQLRREFYSDQGIKRLPDKRSGVNTLLNAVVIADQIVKDVS